MKNRTVHMAYICDTKYAEPTLVSACSAICNKKPRTILHINIVSTGLSTKEKFFFEKLKKHNVHIHILDVENCFNQINTFHNHVSKAAMLKFKLSSLFPKLNKILYIDGDTIIQHDLLSLYNTNLNETYVGAVPDLLGMVEYKHHARFNLKKYFNSGVMLLNLNKIRQDDIEAKLLENKLNDKWKYFMDQDAFNQTFQGNVTWLNPRFNVMMLNDNDAKISFQDKAKIHDLSEQEMWSAYDNATIIHLSNWFKPWDHIEAWDYNIWNFYRKKAQRRVHHKRNINIVLSKNNKKRLQIFGCNLFSWTPKYKKAELKIQQSFNGLKLCFSEGGGLGDCLLILPLIEQIQKQSPTNIQIDFYCRFPEFCKKLPFLTNVHSIKPLNELQDLGYDGVFQIIRNARFIHGNREKIKTLYPLLNSYIESDEKLKSIGQIRDNLRLFNEYTLSLGKKRQDQADLFNIFKYNPNEFSILPPDNEENNLKKYGLTQKNYITINRGCDDVFNNNHPKLWPLENYNKLIELIHKQYPNLKIIQVGKNDSFGNMKGTNLNLLGKTNFEEIASVIKNSIIHIDIEGGLVHLNHILKGKSLCLFGPTSMDVYGYPENINVKGSCILGNCYNIVPNWADKCILDKNSACMKSLTPEHVFEELDKFLSKELNTWYKIVDNSTEEEMLYAPDNIEPMHLPELPGNKTFIFDIDKALKLYPSVKRFGLVFFMGIGDYYYATAFIEQLKKKYPKIHFDAFVSKNFDGNNSPLVADCLKTNPYIENVYLFDGYKNYNNWRSYDYHEVYDMVDKKTLVLPMIYFHAENTPSRLNGLSKVFGLEIPELNLCPIMYDYKPNKIVQTAFNKIKNTDKKIVFIQTTTRSSAYHYEHTDALFKRLLKEGFFIITPEKTNIKNNNLYVIDTKKFKITDSIALLKLIKDSGKEIFVFNMISCFTAISTALNIPCLCVQFFIDKTISTVYFSNVYLITHEYYQKIATDRQFVMPKDTYIMENNFAVYKPEALVKTIKNFIKIIK